MYRADRFSQASKSDRGPITVTVGIAVILFVAIACGVGRKGTKNDTKVATAKPPASVAQPSLAGEMIDAGHIVPQHVTLASAESAYTKRRYREAAASFDVYVQDHPNNVYGHYMLGLSAWKSGDLTRARAAFERALELDSTNIKTLLNLGRVLLEQGRNDDALVCVTAAVKIDTASAEARRMMGRVQTARGQRDSAITSYRLALSLDPTDSWSMNNIGLLLIGEGRYEDALAPLARAVELRPDAPAFANNLGVALERTGHLVAAAESYRAALQNDSTYMKASVSLARVVGKTGNSMTVDTVDVGALAASYDQELQTARKQRLMAKAVAKPDRIQDPEQ